MKQLICTLALVILIGMVARASLFSPVFGERAGLQSQDSNATGTDQAAQPAEPKSGTTLVGCLSGPDSEGKFTLRSMSHRTGVEVLGPIELKDDSGGKVKLTGSWKPLDEPAVKGKEARKFQATEIEVLAQKCEAPSETTPVSKERQQKQQQKQKASANTNGDTTSPK
jgi:hypothetical protein